MKLKMIIGNRLNNLDMDTNIQNLACLGKIMFNCWKKTFKQHLRFNTLQS